MPRALNYASLSRKQTGKDIQLRVTLYHLLFRLVFCFFLVPLATVEKDLFPPRARSSPFFFDTFARDWLFDVRDDEGWRLHPCRPSEILPLETLNISMPICCPIKIFDNCRFGPNLEICSSPSFSVPISIKAPKSATLRTVPTTPRMGPASTAASIRDMSDSSPAKGLQDSTIPVNKEEPCGWPESNSPMFVFLSRGSSLDMESTRFSITANTRSGLT
mmetsp:Transcript_24485/g.40048  ORF Transcript_24485/g.40048 Transcript_24485/m.40048 type:complete len:218 (-) Transcript_24485:688-1341(-)